MTDDGSPASCPHPETRATAARIGWRIALLVVALWLAATVFRAPGIAGWVGPVLLAVTALFPAGSLLVLAAFVPLQIPVGALLEAQAPLGELLVLSWLGGVALWRARVPSDREERVPVVILLFGLAILLSYAVVAAAVRERLGPEVFTEQLWLLASGQYLGHPIELEQRAAFHALQGVGLLAGALSVLSRRPEFRVAMLRMLAAGGAGVAALNLLRLVTVALASATPLETLLQLARELRIDTQFGDVNAAGSYFALSLFCAVGTWLGVRGAWRALAAAGVLCILAALWLTGSRGAMLGTVAAAIGVLVIARGQSRPQPRSRLVSAGAVIGLAVALTMLAVFVLPNTVLGRGIGRAGSIRQDMAIVSFRLLQQSPVFGIGVGQFYQASEGILRDLPAGKFYSRENAHNQFLQVLSELGVVGMALFLATLGAVLRPGIRRFTAGRSSAGEAAAIAGVAAFLVSALFGHPLLVAPVAYVFWMTLGSLPRGDALEATPRAAWRGRAAVAAALVLLATWPARTKQHLDDLYLEHIGHGLSSWRIDESGVRYRSAEGAATVFVPTSVAAVTIPLYVQSEREVAEVTIQLEDRIVNRLQVRSGEWTRYQFVRRGDRNRRFVPVTLAVADGGILRVGKLEAGPR